MRTLMPLDTDVHIEKFGPDPVLLRKKGMASEEPKKISYYKEKITDDRYIDFAINRIAMELSHFLVK